MSEALAVISGVVEDLVVHDGEEEFIRSSGQQAAGVVAAAGLAAAGMAGAGVGASMAAAASGDRVQFFSCKVNGQLVNGRFSRVTFKNGDELRFVVDTSLPNTFVALASCRAKDQTLWMAPHCSRGTKAHLIFAWCLFLKLLIGFPLFGLASYLILGVWAHDWALRDSGLDLAGAISLMLGVIAALHFSIRFYRQWLPITQQAERVFAALGYPDPSRVDLPRDHKRYSKAHGLKWPYLTDGPWIYHYLNPR